MPPAIPLTCWTVSPKYNQGATLLQSSTDAIVGFGFKSAGYFLSPNYKGDIIFPGLSADYPGQNWGGGPSPTNLTQLVQTPGFQYVLNDSSLQRVYFKTWTFATGIFDTWRDSATSTQLANEYTEIFNLATYLLQNTSGKDFYIQTSESDWAYLGATTEDARGIPTTQVPTDRAARAIAFFGNRIKAVSDARATAGKSSSRVFSVVEVNRALDAGNRIHRDVLPYLTPDAISFSIYEAINGWLGGLNQAASLTSIDILVRLVVKQVREEYAKTHGVQAANAMPLYVGEFGWPEKNAAFIAGGGTLDVKAFVTQFLTSAAAAGFQEANFWQCWCNDVGPAGGLPNGVLTDQCMQRSDGTLTNQGQQINTLLTT